MEKMHLLSRNRIFVDKQAERVQLICPVCLFAARHENDLNSIQKEQACEECTLNFKYLDLAAWKKGRRPSKDEARSKMIIKIGDIK